MEIINGKINLTTPCNSDCHCSGFSYTPVCWEETGDTFFNPCTASCNAYSKENKVKAFIKLFSSHFWCRDFISVLSRMRVCTRGSENEFADEDFHTHVATFCFNFDRIFKYFIFITNYPVSKSIGTDSFNSIHFGGFIDDGDNDSKSSKLNFRRIESEPVVVRSRGDCKSEREGWRRFSLRRFWRRKGWIWIWRWEHKWLDDWCHDLAWKAKAGRRWRESAVG